MTGKKIFDHTFRDSKGNLAIMHWPNVPLYGWIAFKLGAMISNNQNLTDTYNGISTTFLLVWATLEITSGLSYFRRILGLVVFVATVSHYMA